MESTAHLLWSVFFSSLGIGFLIYGRRQRAAMPFLSGIGLALMPYFLSNSYVLVLAGCGVVSLPYFFRV